MKQLALKTTQNVVIEYPAATTFERIIAGILDLFIVGILSWFFIFFTSSFFERFGVDRMGEVFLILMPLVILIAYHTLSEYFANGQSVGKRVLGIRVVRVDGQRAGMREAVLRSIVLIIDLVLSSGVIGSLLIATSRRRQRLGDMAANTVIIKSAPPKPFRLKDIVEIKSIEDYEPTYPQVINFTEKDILQVKDTLKRLQRYKNDAHRKAFMKMVKRLAKLLELKEIPRDRVAFVKTIIRDYIVLTR